MIQLGGLEFDTAAYLTHAGLGRRIVQLEPKQTLFSQGDPADSIFYLQNGRAKITIVSQTGKEATITILTSGDFAGEESLTATHGLRLATATAITDCTALKINREEMIRVMHEEHEFSDLFLKFLLARSMRTPADLVDQLFNSSEKRLARILLLMAEFGKPGEPEQYIPEITQEDPDAAPDLLKSLDLGTVIEFDFAEGDERTQTGSHYTPDDLVQPLIKHSLDCPGAVVM